MGITRLKDDDAGVVLAIFVRHYHDADLDGDIRAADEAHLSNCITNAWADPMCVFAHERNRDYMVDLVDAGVFYGAYTGSLPATRLRGVAWFAGSKNRDQLR